MADESEDVAERDTVQPEETHEPETLEEQASVGTDEQESPLQRLRGRIAYALAWLRRPDEVGQPLTLQPRGIRLLILLILGNLIVLTLLTVGLYRASTMLVVVESPLALPTTVTTMDTNPGSIPTIRPGAVHGATPGPTPTPFGSGGAIATSTPSTRPTGNWCG